MKLKFLSSAVFLLLGLGCASTPDRNMDSSSATTVETDGMGTITTSPTPNVEYEQGAVSGITEQDPEGDIAPIVPCKNGEIERRQSGKIVCVNPDTQRPGSTMTGR